MLIYCPDTNLTERRWTTAFYKVLDSDISVVSVDEEAALYVSRGKLQEDAWWYKGEGKPGFIWTYTWKIGGKGNIEPMMFEDV